MDAKAKELGVPRWLVVYPQAKHDFISGPDYRADDAAEAWARITEPLRQHLG
jgi:acetyl esterase/lipase